VKVVSASSVFGSYLGESEKNLRDIFEKADEERSKGKTIVLFFDEVLFFISCIVISLKILD